MVRAGAMVGVRAAAGAAAGKAGGAARPKASDPEGALKRHPSGWSWSGSSGGRPRWVDPIWVSLIPRSFALEPLDSGVGKAWISLDSLVRNEPFQWVTRDFPRKKILGPCPSAGGGGTGEAERRNGRKRRSRGEDRSWGELSAASGFLQSIVARHALAEIVAPDIRRRRSLSAASLGPAPGSSIAPIAHAARGVVRGALAGAAIPNSNDYYYGGYGPGWGPGWGPRCGWGGCWYGRGSAAPRMHNDGRPMGEAGHPASRG